AHQAVELGQEIFVLPPRPLHALRCRQSPAPAAVGALHPALPLEVGRLMMNLRVPDEVRVQKVVEVVAGSVSCTPGLDPLAIKGLKRGARVPLLRVVASDQVAGPPSAISNRICIRMERSGSDRTSASSSPLV